ncbi:DUF3791 domain-containing protein [Adlercreutzia muris]|uniref:DUF3791 domain-containing protein n=1 Tax=Adlercreutzia muris TaxID=1796610 RepID=UPI0025A54A95|nr:DUF3791 domain-containing protein [uncultured Adlercreutzia sp.]
MRLAQKRWGLPAAEIARIFRHADVCAYISELYDLLHLSSYDRALDDVENHLAAKKCSPCCRTDLKTSTVF